MSVWTTDARTADAIDATAGLTREQLLERLHQLAHTLTDEALFGAVVFATMAPKRKGCDIAALEEIS